MGGGLSLPVPKGTEAEVERIVTIFRELRDGKTLDGKTALKVPSGSLSTAEAIAVMVGGLSQAAWFMEGALDAEALRLERVALGLRTTQGIPLDLLDAAAGPRLEVLVSEGLARIEHGRLILIHRGRALVDPIAAELV